MELQLTKNPLKIELNLSQFRAKTEVGCVELYSDSVGNQWGIYLELVWNWLANPMYTELVWNWLANPTDCLGMCWECIGAAGE